MLTTNPTNLSIFIRLVEMKQYYNVTHLMHHGEKTFPMGLRGEPQLRGGQEVSQQNGGAHRKVI